MNEKNVKNVFELSYTEIGNILSMLILRMDEYLVGGKLNENLLSDFDSRKNKWQQWSAVKYNDKEDIYVISTPDSPAEIKTGFNQLKTLFKKMGLSEANVEKIIHTKPSTSSIGKERIFVNCTEFNYAFNDNFFSFLNVIIAHLEAVVRYKDECYPYFMDSNSLDKGNATSALTTTENIFETLHTHVCNYGKKLEEEVSILEKSHQQDGLWIKHYGQVVNGTEKLVKIERNSSEAIARLDEMIYAKFQHKITAILKNYPLSYKNLENLKTRLIILLFNYYALRGMLSECAKLYIDYPFLGYPFAERLFAAERGSTSLSDSERRRLVLWVLLDCQKMLANGSKPAPIGCRAGDPERFIPLVFHQLIEKKGIPSHDSLAQIANLPDNSQCITVDQTKIPTDTNGSPYLCYLCEQMFLDREPKPIPIEMDRTGKINVGNTFLQEWREKAHKDKQALLRKLLAQHLNRVTQG